MPTENPVLENLVLWDLLSKLKFLWMKMYFFLKLPLELDLKFSMASQGLIRGYMDVKRTYNYIIYPNNGHLICEQTQNF